MNKDFANRISWKKNQEVDYMYVDFTYLDDFEVYQVIILFEKTLHSSTETNQRILVDYTGTDFGYSIFSTMAKIIIVNLEKIRKIAACGLGEEFVNHYSETTKSTKQAGGVFKTFEEGLSFVTAS